MDNKNVTPEVQKVLDKVQSLDLSNEDVKRIVQQLPNRSDLQNNQLVIQKIFQTAESQLANP